MIPWKRKLFWKKKKIFLFSKWKRILFLMLIFLLLKLMIIYVFWRITLIIWAPLWANVLLIILNWNLCFARNIFHIFMHTPHGIHNMHTMFTPMFHILYARVYTCTHYDRKGHLVKFYFDRLYSLNFANKNVWVPLLVTLMDPRRLGTKISTCFLCRCGLSQKVRGLAPW